MEFTQEQIKNLLEKYPFLVPRNYWTDSIIEDEYKFRYFRGQYELPQGWIKLFLLYCKNIRPLLINAHFLDKFRFSQIKEKYGTMRLYNMGYPAKMSDVTTAYEVYSKYICESCGNFARYRTTGWIESFCLKCKGSINPAKRLCKKLIYGQVTYINGKKSYKLHSLFKIHKEYKRCLKMTDEEFLAYLLNN